MIKRLWVWIPAGGGRIFFSWVDFVCWLLFGVHSTLVLLRWQVILPKVQVDGYAQTCIQPWPNEFGVGWLWYCVGIVWEPIRKQTHTQFVREHSATVFSACCATEDWSWSKELNNCVPLNLHFKKKKHRWWINCHSPKIIAHEEKATTTTHIHTHMQTAMFFFIYFLFYHKHSPWEK